ncbi:MAG: TIGR04283 family arsenosugar biosynthesis glycosyltransferase [Winogradskyella arenosi]
MISIIIPVLNEADSIGTLLSHLVANMTSKKHCEIIVVDGGSTDRTTDIISAIISQNPSEQSEILSCEALKDGSETKVRNQNFKQTALQLITSEKGRAKQMNQGAKQAKGDILYFLHADSFPPKGFDQLIIDEVKAGHEAGCFRMTFNSSHWWLQLAGWFTQFSWRACRGGDQSQFITASLFNAIGGYDENYTIYEDNMLINALYERNTFVVINKKLTTSARRYQKHGVWTLQYHFWAIYIKKYFGASADDLLHYYKKHIC